MAKAVTKKKSAAARKPTKAAAKKPAKKKAAAKPATQDGPKIGAPPPRVGLNARHPPPHLRAHLGERDRRVGKEREEPLRPGVVVELDPLRQPLPPAGHDARARRSSRPCGRVEAIDPPRRSGSDRTRCPG